MIEKEKLLQAAKKLGIVFENEEVEVEEIIAALKEYGIRVVNEREAELLREEARIFELKKAPEVKWCGPFPDGKARRRDRRKQERLLKKRKKS